MIVPGSSDDEEVLPAGSKRTAASEVVIVQGSSDDEADQGDPGERAAPKKVGECYILYFVTPFLL